VDSNYDSSGRRILGKHGDRNLAIVCKLPEQTPCQCKHHQWISVDGFLVLVCSDGSFDAPDVSTSLLLCVQSDRGSSGFLGSVPLGVAPFLANLLMTVQL
jgi:hypothetical protein